MEGVQWQSHPVVGHVDLHLTKFDNFAKGCEGVVESLGDVVTAVVNRDDGGEGTNAQQAEQLRDAVAQLLVARRAAQLQAAALQELKGSYVASGEATDFAAELQQRAAAAAERQPHSVQEDPLYREFLAAAAGAGGDDAGPAGDNEVVDDELEIVGAGRQLAPNATCPITTKPLLQLEDPVEDAQGVVYERTAVLAYLRQKRGRAAIVAGSNHEVTPQELRPAEKVLRAKKKAAREAAAATRRGGTQRQQQQQPGEEVLEI